MVASMQRNGSKPPEDAAEEPHYHGHRERLRERFFSAGPEALSDYELLEMALFAAIPRRDTKPLAKALLKKFGSFAEVVHAPVARLREVDGIKDASINQLKLLAAAAGRIAKGEIRRSVALSSWNDVIDYCRSGMAFSDKEQFRLLFLDKRNQLISLRRSHAVAGRHPDDQGHHRHRSSLGHLRARPHHRRQERARESEGDAADLGSVTANSRERRPTAAWPP
jgi:DNA repair protein RadC